MIKSFSLPKIRLQSLRKAILIALLIVVSFTGGYFTGFGGFRAQLEGFPKVIITRELPPDKQTLDFGLFWRVWDILQAQHLDKEGLIPSELVYGAISGMVGAVGDPYTVFLSPGENKVIQEDLQGNFQGVGIQIGFKGSRLVVIAPLPDTPAEKAGLKAGDFIVGIKDEAKGIDRGTEGITLPEAVQVIRGPAGTKVTLLIAREGQDELVEIEVVRAKIEVSSVEVSYVGEGQNIAHIKILKFAGETLREWQNAVRSAEARQVKGVILDIRNNPGGFLQGAVDVAADFVENDTVIVVEEEASGERGEFRTERVGRLTNTPTVILLNGGSASASEILAGALREIKGFQIVGEKSFGKGTIQEPQQLDNGAALHITVARWLTPSNVSVDDGGLEPDVIIEDNPDTEEDEQLLKAIEILSISI